MAPVQPPRFVVVVDAAHGGSDTGAKIGAGILEKDITLELAGRLRSVLKARGVDVVMTRQTDTDVTALDRAQTANHAQAAACLVMHATATGSGLHLYTSSLGPDGEGSIFAVGDGAGGVCDAEPEAGVGDRFGAGACGHSGDAGAGIGAADG